MLVVPAVPAIPAMAVATAVTAVRGGRYPLLGAHVRCTVLPVRVVIGMWPGSIMAAMLPCAGPMVRAVVVGMRIAHCVADVGVS